MTHGFIIGQAPPKPPVERPFGRTKLYAWFETIGLDKARMDELFDYGSLVAEFLGSGKSGHLPPAREKIAAFRPVLLRQVKASGYQLIIPVGKMAVQAVLNDKAELHEVVGKKFTVQPFGEGMACTVIPLPHPSGASTWVYQEDNKILLQQAFKLIKAYLSSC